MEKKKSMLISKLYTVDESLLFMYLVIFTMYAYPILYFIGCFLGEYYLIQRCVLSITLLQFTIILLYKIIKGNKIILNTIDLISLLLIISVLLSTYFTKDPGMTYVGDPIDHESYIQIITYYVLVIIGMRIVDKDKRKKVINAAIILGIIEISAGLFQHFGLWFIDGNNMLNCKNNGIAYGFTYNQNLFAVITVIFTSYFVGNLFVESEIKKEIYYGVLSLFAFFCSMTTASRNAWLGIIGMHIALTFIFILRFYIKRDKSEWISFIWKESIILLGSVAIIVAMYKTNDFTFVSQVNETINDKDNLSDNGDIDRFGSSRGAIWRMGLEAIPHNWLFGVGTDNFRYAITSNPNYEYVAGQYVHNKAHCEYLHVLVNGGIFSFIYYMALLIMSFYSCMKSVIKDYKLSEDFILIIVFVAYCFQALVNGSTIETAPYFWIIVGMINSNKKYREWLILSKKTISICKYEIKK